MRHVYNPSMIKIDELEDEDPIQGILDDPKILKNRAKALMIDLAG